VEDAAVAGFIAGVKSLTQDQARWWDAVAPGLNRPTPLVGVGVPRYNSPLQVAIAARGSTATSVTLSTTVTVTGGRAPGRYAVSVAEAIHGATLVISSWAMRPA
jgi:hypothetical protein